jgi:hypothetical protein
MGAPSNDKEIEARYEFFGVKTIEQLDGWLAFAEAGGQLDKAGHADDHMPDNTARLLAMAHALRLMASLTRRHNISLLAVAKTAIVTALHDKSIRQPSSSPEET